MIVILRLSQLITSLPESHCRLIVHLMTEILSSESSTLAEMLLDQTCYPMKRYIWTGFSKCQMALRETITFWLISRKRVKLFYSKTLPASLLSPSTNLTLGWFLSSKMVHPHRQIRQESNPQLAGMVPGWHIRNSTLIAFGKFIWQELVPAHEKILKKF